MILVGGIDRPETMAIGLKRAEYAGELPLGPWPRTTHDVDVEMMDFLPALGTGIHDDPEATFRIGPAALLYCEPGCERHDLAQQRSIIDGDLRHRRDVPLRHDHEVNRGPRCNIVEDKKLIV